MVQKSHILENKKREKAQRLYSAAPVLSEQFPSVKELVVELRFIDPAGKATPSPHTRIFWPDMQAFFQFQCPLKECNDGGFNLGPLIPKALGKRNTEARGQVSCEGKRKREGVADPCCNLELHYHVSIRRE
jgi:hypothetical protein